MLVSSVCKLLNPLEQDLMHEIPAENAPESLIMQSDLLSGGLEPHLYCLLEEKYL